MRTRKSLISSVSVAFLIVSLAGCGYRNPKPLSGSPTALPSALSTSTPTPTPAVTSVPTSITTPEPTPKPSATGESTAFTYASPESQDLAPEAVNALVETVSGYVQDDKVVGSELLVLKNRRIVLHEAFGWRDRDGELAMPTHTIFNIRSMTKPVVATGILMLVEEGEFALEDPVAKYIPSFDNDRSREITIVQLLTHRSGLPLSLVMTSFGEYETLRDLADDAGEGGPDFEPGTAFQYSDTGFDVLGVLIEVVSGMPLTTFIQTRILDPLSMVDTVTEVRPDDPRIDRMASLYVGGQGNWSCIWDPQDEPLYRFPMGSQSLYSTPLDYARFLALWMDEGRIGDMPLLSPETVRQALTPVSDSKMPGAFPDLRLDYGQGWIIYVPDDAPEGDAPEGDAPEGESRMALFGHSGSDGTWAWVWPEEDLIVLYFTQSRGQGTGIGLEDTLDRLFIHPDREDATVPAELRPYLGIYTAHSGPLMYKPFEITVQNGRLAVNLPDQIVVALEDPDEEGLWRLTLDPSIAVSFVEDERGQITIMRWHQAGEVFNLPRGAPPEEPPLDLAMAERYLGTYQNPEEDHSVEVIIHNEHLSLQTPDTMVPLEFFSPDEEGRWRLRLNPALAISFQEDDEGIPVSLTVHSPEGDVVHPRVEEEP